MKTDELIKWLDYWYGISPAFTYFSQRPSGEEKQAYQQIKQILHDYSRLTSEPSDGFLEEKAIEWHEEHGLRGYLDIHEKERYMRDIRQFIKDWQGGGK